jgi:integrase
VEINMDIQPADRSLPATVDERLVRSNRLASKADETKRALLKNWTLFEGWCQDKGVACLPATPEVVEVFLLYLADRHPVQERAGRTVRVGLKSSGVSQALWAINTRHRLAGHPPPGEYELIKTALAGIRRRKGSRRKQQAPFTIEHLRAIAFRADLKGRRDRALLLVGFAGCLRRSELVALRAEDLEETPLGLRIYLAKSKTDQEGEGAWIDIVRAERFPACCPVQALQDWLAAAGIVAGPIFRSLGKGARPRLGDRLSPVTVDAVVKWAAAQCGLDPSRYGGHSLRAGKATYLSEMGKSPTLIARHGRWKSMDMVLTYCRGETARELAGVY